MSNIASIYISYIRLLSKFQPKRTRSSVWNACGRDRVRGFYGMERGAWKEAYNGRWISIMERFLEVKIKPLNNKPKNNNNNNNSKNSENNNSLKSLFSCMNRQFLANFCITIFFCKWLCLTCQRVFYKIRHASAKFLNTFD